MGQKSNNAVFFCKSIDKFYFSVIIIVKKLSRLGILEELIMFEKLKELLVEELQIDEKIITMDAELANDLGINSIDLADLVMMCEDKFGIEISDTYSNTFITVADVVDYLESL